MFKTLAKKVHEANRKQGFYEDIEKIQMLIIDQNPDLLKPFQQTLFASRMALLISEASEALEGNRKSIKTPPLAMFLKEEILPNMPDEEFKEWFKKNIKDSEEDELADVQIRLLDEVGRLEIDLDFHVEQKLRFNSLRPKKHGKEY